MIIPCDESFHFFDIPSNPFLHFKNCFILYFDNKKDIFIVKKLSIIQVSIILFNTHIPLTADHYLSTLDELLQTAPEKPCCLKIPLYLFLPTYPIA